MADGQDPAAVSPPTARVLDVIEAMARRPERVWTLAELVRVTGMTRATAHAVLSTLHDRGWVHRGPDKTYAIGSYLAVLGRELAASRPLERLAHDAIAKLAVEHGRLALVVHRVADAVVVTDVAPPPGHSSGIAIGHKVPYLPPFGPGFAAWAPAAEQRRWVEQAAALNPELGRRLEEVLPAIRRRGYSLERTDRATSAAWEVLARLQDDVFSDAVRAVVTGVLTDLTQVDYLPGELARGGRHAVTSIAAPVFGADGSVALNLAFQVGAELRATELRGLGEALADAAGAVGSAASGSLA